MTIDIGSINVEPQVILTIDVEPYEGSHYGIFKEAITGSSTSVLHVSYSGLIREALDWAAIPHPPIQDIEDESVLETIIDNLDKDIYDVTISRK